jgi:hypothetical protein
VTASLGDIVRAHLDRDDLAVATAGFYADVDTAIVAHAPLCRNRGHCCEFDTYGHKLYVTTVELIHFAHGNRRHWPPSPTDPQSAIHNQQVSCPFRVRGLCTARDHRPLGCRIFFCDPAARPWQGPEYELRLADLKRIGAAFGVEYLYTEWLSALPAVGTALGLQNWADSAGIDAAHRDMID